MEKTSATLSVFHDGQFFTALFERNDKSGYSAARVLFAAKPSDNEIFELILKRYSTLRYSSPTESGGMKLLAASPKRRQRYAAKAAQTVSMTTKAQMALKNQHEEQKAASKAVSRQQHEHMADEKYQKKQQKRKKKHKGR